MPQCKAKSKRSGVRCQHRAMNGMEVCWNHGGATRQAKRKAAERIAQAELLKAAQGDPELADATPAELLLHAAHSTGKVVLMLQKQGVGQSANPAQLDLLGQWLDRLSRAASVVVSSKADELVINQQARVVEGQARQLTEIMNRVLNAVGLSSEQAALVPAALQSALESLGLIPDPVTPSGAAKDSSGRLPTPAILAALEELL